MQMVNGELQSLAQYAAAWPGWQVLLLLFTISLLAATLLPGGSEAVFLLCLSQRPELAWPLIFVAGLGNTIGGMANYWLARLLPKPRETRATVLLQKHGAKLILFSWVPWIGDALCFAAGWLRLPQLPVLLYMAAGKIARYLVLFALYKQF